MNSLIAFFILMSLLASSFAGAETVRPRHFLVFIHGVGGTSDTFGYMPQALEKALEKDAERKKSPVDFVPFKFVYATGDSALTSDDFALQLGQYLNQQIKPRMKSANDKISLITHSQGGLVATIWYFHAFLERHGAQKEKTYYPEFVPHMDALVTIGTPFWGSRLATFLVEDSWASKTVKGLAGDALSKMGELQLQEMALASHTIVNFRRNVTTLSPVMLEGLKSMIRPLNIAGVAKAYDIINQKNHGRYSPGQEILWRLGLDQAHFESDLSVSVASSRFDSYYTLARDKNYKESTLFPIEKTYRTSFSPFLIVNTIHASPWPELYYDMAWVPVECYDKIDCLHPTFSHVYNHLRRASVPEFSGNVESWNFNNFTTSFRVNFPEDVDARNVKVEIELFDHEMKNKYHAFLGRSWEVGGSYEFYHPRQKYIYMSSITGQIEDKLPRLPKDKKSPPPLKSVVKISAPGFKTRYIETWLHPTFSTYVEVNLEKRR